MRLSIKAIIRWEQLNKKPFSKLDYSSEDDIISLFYTCTLSESHSLEKSLDEFKKSLSEDDTKQMILDFERQTFLVAQFQGISKKSNDSNNSKVEPDPIYIKDIVPMLVLNGLDVHFAYDMELCDLSIFLHAYDQKTKDDLTVQRLWAFMQLSPHLKKGATPKDVYPFSWETEGETVSEEQMEEGKNEFQTFLQSGLKI